MAQKNREKYAYLDQLSTQQLEELLLADAEEASGLDTSEVVFHILEVLRKREVGPAEESVDVDRAWEEFQKYYLTSEDDGQPLYPCGEDLQDHQEKVTPKSKKPTARSHALWRTLRIVAATVAVLFVLMVGAQASGWDVFGTLAQWTSETFHFGTKESEIQSENYQLFLTTLVENDIAKEFAPTWCPSGFIASEPIVKINDSVVSVKIPFTDADGNTFYFGIERYSSQIDLENNSFEKDNISAKPYLSHGKAFYIFPNIDSVTATWAEGSLVETIWGNLSEDDIKTIIDSIGGS